MTPSEALDIAAKLVASFVSNNSLPAGELPAMISCRFDEAQGWGGNSSP